MASLVTTKDQPISENLVLKNIMKKKYMEYLVTKKLKSMLIKTLFEPFKRFLQLVAKIFI